MQPRQQPSSPRPAPRQTNVERAFQGNAPAPAQPTPRRVDTRDLFKRAQQKISSTRDDGSSKWINAEIKQRWMDNNTPLFLHKLVYQANSRYGAQWTLHISEDDPGNPVWFASFKSNDYRDVLFPELQTAIDSAGSPIGPLMLTVHQVEGQPNGSWDLQPWTEDGIPF